MLLVNISKWVLRNIFLGFIRKEQRSRRKREPNSSGGSSPTTPRRDDPPGHFDANWKQPKKRSSSSSDISKQSARLPGSTTVCFSPKMVPAVAPAALSSLNTRPHPLRKTNLTPLTPEVSSNIVPLKDDSKPHTRPRLQMVDPAQPLAALSFA